MGYGIDRNKSVEGCLAGDGQSQSRCSRLQVGIELPWREDLSAGSSLADRRR